MIILAWMTSFAYSYKDFESSVQEPLKKRLIFNVLHANIKDQMHDLAQYDVIKNLPISMKKSKHKVQISEKETTTSYYDEKGNLVDASEETAAKLYQHRIEVIPDSLAIHTEVQCNNNFTPLE